MDFNYETQQLIDTITLTDDEETMISNAQASGKIIQPNENGRPVAVDPEPVTSGYLPTNLEKLWQAANSYQEAQISGAAIGVLTIGAIASKPKCKAVMQWIDTIWNGHYYPRKATLTDSEPVDPALLDFSVCGDMPHTVTELYEEVS